MKHLGRVTFLTLLACNLTAAVAQESHPSRNLVTREAWSGSVNGRVSYGYDNDVHTVLRRVNDRPPIVFSYDADKLLTHAGDLTITRNPQNSLITGTQLGNISDSWSYNEFAEPTHYSAVFGTTQLYEIQFARDASGRITALTETVGGVKSEYAYHYDVAGWITNVILNGATFAAYTYDSNGNRLSATVGAETHNGSYDPQDRLIAYGAGTYTYKPQGALASKTLSTQTSTFDYDVFGSLIGVQLASGTSIRYLVDGLNHRVGKSVNNSRVRGFLYNRARRVVAELDGADQVISEFVYGVRGHVPDYLIKDGETYRVVSDQLGSPRLVVNAASGQLAQRIDYDPFGRVLSDTAPGFQPFGFAGGLYDVETGLIRFGARDYDPETGRWTAKDPILFGGGQANLYAYVDNDPVNRIDPSGLQGKGTQCLPSKHPPARPDKKSMQNKDTKKKDNKIKKLNKNNYRSFSPSTNDEDDDLEDLEVQR